MFDLHTSGADALGDVTNTFFKSDRDEYVCQLKRNSNEEQTDTTLVVLNAKIMLDSMEPLSGRSIKLHIFLCTGLSRGPNCPEIVELVIGR